MNRVLIQRMEAAVLLRRGVYLVLAGGVSIVLLNLAGVGGLASVIVPVMIYMLGMGLVQPNATAAAMAPHGRLAGVASSVIGSLQTAGGALSGWVVGAFYDHTPTSLALTVGAMGVATFLVHASARVGRHVAEREAAAPPLAAEA
jgi:DHA1 family bicyclomycin/chloramphenicol resistance-like MFS transporter